MQIHSKADLDANTQRGPRCKYAQRRMKYHHFPQKSPIINGSFAERDLQLNEGRLICDYRVAKTHRMPYLDMSFAVKERYN